jgi:hypothetical protein
MLLRVGSWWLAALMALVVAGGVLLPRSATFSAVGASPGASESAPREPLLACLVGLVLAAVLMGAAEWVATTEVGQSAGGSQKSALPDRRLAQARRVAAQRPPTAGAGPHEPAAALPGGQALWFILLGGLIPVAAVTAMIFCGRTAHRASFDPFVPTTSPDSENQSFPTSNS